jgi:putative hemolysin
METGSYSINRVRLHANVESGKSGASLLSWNLKNPQLFIFTTLVCHNLFVFIASTLATNLVVKSGLAKEEVQLYWKFIPWSAEIATTFILMLPLFIFGDVGPKNLFRTRAEYLMYPMAGLQRVCIIICLPITYPLKLLAGMLTSSENLSHELKNIDEQMLKHFFSESQQDGVISPRENKMIARTMQIHKIYLADIMLPIDKISSVPVSISPEDCLEIYREKDINRIPVYEENINNIIGMVHFFDALTAIDNNDKDLRNCLKNMVELDVNINLQEAFYKLRRQKEAIAIVVGKSRKKLGIIRLRDIVRHITSN